jgi:hypothetical protein
VTLVACTLVGTRGPRSCVVSLVVLLCRFLLSLSLLLLCRTLALSLCGASCCDSWWNPTILRWLSRQQQRWRRRDSGGCRTSSMESVTEAVRSLWQLSSMASALDFIFLSRCC